MKKKKKIKKKINYQKFFCFGSFIFILTCIFWYGGRFIYFYQESKKIVTEEADTLVRIVKKENHEKDTFRKIEKDYYFYGDVTNNYVSYSNLLWRIIKINEDNSVVLITDNIVSTLAYGNNELEYKDSSLVNWLNVNDENSFSGTFDKFLNEKDKYLIKTSTCIDNVDDIEKISCNNIYNNGYSSLLSIQDYIYTGGNKGFINKENYNYLANKNSDNEIWYINNEGKLELSNGEDILGLRTTVTLSPNLEIKKGTGTIDDPYYFEDNISLIGSYVKLGNDVWRIYEEKDGIVKLSLQNVIIDGDSNLKYHYSKKNFYHNDTVKGSLAYYLNHDYYNELSYKDLIIENNYTNGYYGSDTEYKLDNIYESTINTKITVPSIGDIIFNDELDSYFTNTGISKNSSLIYIQREKGLVTTKSVTIESFVVPCISINKDKLVMGTGNIDDPYRTE